MHTLITAGTILTPDEIIENQDLTIDGEKILSIDTPGRTISDGNEIIDAKGCYVVPGFIDIHAHGANGFDTMDATSDAIIGMGSFFARHGVTSFLPTTVAASARDIQAAIDNVASMPPFSDAAQHLGIHLEGPYLSQEYRGAQSSQHLHSANPREYMPWIGRQGVRLITVAPEVEGVPDLIRAGTEAGIEFALGHTSASYEQALAAVDLGLRQATHTFNGMARLDHHTAGVLGAVLSDDRIRAQIIVDGIHVHPAMVRLLIRAKGIDRTILITDSMRAAGMPDGDYALGDQMAHVKDGVARTGAGGLAGSTLTMDQALRNVMMFGAISLPVALPMATRVPAAAIGLKDSKGLIAPGFDADIVILDKSYNVQMTMVGGRVVYGNL